MAFINQMRSGTLDNIPGIGDDMRLIYRDLKRMASTNSVISDISEEDKSENNNDFDELAERLHGVDLADTEVVWSKLSESERKEMGQIAQRQNMSAVLPSFNPWWENKVQRVQISEVDGDQSNAVCIEHEYTDLSHPKIKKKFAEFACISPEAPTTDVQNNLTNVLAAYTSTVRFFYGEHLRSAYDAVKYLFVICSSLKSDDKFIDPKLAIESIRKEARKEGLSIDDDDLVQMEKDVGNITEGPDPNSYSNCYIMAALSDLYRLFQLAKSRSTSLAPRKHSTSSRKTLEIIPSKEQAKEFQQFMSRFGDYKIVEFISMDKNKISSTMKKVEYFLAYAHKFLSYSS